MGTVARTDVWNEGIRYRFYSQRYSWPVVCEIYIYIYIYKSIAISRDYESVNRNYQKHDYNIDKYVTLMDRNTLSFHQIISKWHPNVVVLACHGSLFHDMFLSTLIHKYKMS